MISTRKSIAKQVGKAREKKGLTQAEVAQKAEISVTYYAMIERGEENPSSDILGKLGKVLGITIKI